MKGIRKKIYCFSLAAVLSASTLLGGCGEKEVAVNTYTSDNGMYELSLPGEWDTNDNMGMDGMLNLARKDGAVQERATAVALGVTKAQSGANDLQGFQSYVQDSVLTDMFATSKVTEAEAIDIPDMKSCIAGEAAVSQTDGKKGNIFLEYMESEQAYYLVMLAPNSGNLKDLDSLKEKLALKELKVEEPGADASDTIRWFNATYAILTKVNQGNINLPGGYETNEAVKESVLEMLERDWEIKGREGMEESLEWLMAEGHNKEALEYLEEQAAGDMTREELAAAMEESGFNPQEETIMYAAYDAKAEFGDNAIKGWDQSRAMQLLGSGYQAGFYTYEEAMDKSMEFADRIRQTFTSWDEFMKSYFYGFEYWSGEDLEQAGSKASERWEIYQELKDQENGPYSLDWNMEFVNDWSKE